jgi:hypothetical protein
VHGAAGCYQFEEAKHQSNDKKSNIVHGAAGCYQFEEAKHQSNGKKQGIMNMHFGSKFIFSHNLSAIIL